MNYLKSLRHTITLYLIGLFLLTMPTSALCAQTPDASLLSQGRWVKVHIDTTAVHHIPNTLLKEWGFDHPDRLIVAGYGSVERAHSLDTAPDDLPILPVRREKDGIYFFAEGDSRVTLNTHSGTASNPPFTTHYNYYSSGSYYFIGECPGLASPEVTILPDDGTNEISINTHKSLSHKLYREMHPSPHGLLSLSRNITADSPRSIDFDIRGHNGTAMLYYNYAWLHSQTSDQSIGLSFSPDVTDAAIPKESLAKNVKSHMIFSVNENATADLTLSNDTDRFTATFSNPSGAFTTLALVSTSLIYTRQNRIDAAPVIMRFPSLTTGAVMQFEHSGRDVNLWDVTDPRNPALLQTTPTGTNSVRATVPQQRTAMTVFAYDAGAELPVPTFAGEVSNQNLHSLSGADMLIVTTAATYAAAMRLAAAHEKWQGMRVEVVRQSDVFNEFSSGALHPNGVRTLVRRLAADNSRPLRYLLMFGNGTWDTKATFDTSGREYLVSYGTEDPSEMGFECHLYTSDLYFGTLSSTIPPALSQLRPAASVSVGRIPATDPASAEAYVDKCEAYLSDPTLAGAFNHAIVAGSPADNSQHIICAENHAAIISSMAPAPTIHRAHLSLFALDKPPVIRSGIYNKYLSLIFGGDSRIFNYTGHSSLDAIAYNTFRVTHEKNTFYRSMPVVFMTSCNTSPIDRQETSIGKAMIMHNPGPIAVIGAGNEVYLKYNVRFHEQFLRLFYSHDAGECIGDVFRLAVTSTNTSSAQTTNNLCYNFLGDPALPRYLPTRTVDLTSVGEVDDLNRQSQVSVPPMAPVHLAGTVNTFDGAVDTSFNGRLTLCIYEAPVTKTTLVHVNGDEKIDLSIDDSLLHTSIINVTDGHWETDVILPATIHAGPNRMTLNAISGDRILASGGNNVLFIDNDALPIAASADTAPPEIHLWIDSPGMTDGDEVSPSPTIHIDITDDDSGISLNTSAPGMAPKVFIDGVSIPTGTYLMHPTDVNTASAEFTLNELADGLHTLTVTARDLNGNTARESISFTVLHRDTTASLGFNSSIVRDDITFTLSHSLPSASVRSARLVIRDMTGRCVLSTDAVTYPYTWDFTSADGTPVPDGTYRASVIIDAHPYYTSTPETQFTIIKR